MYDHVRERVEEIFRDDDEHRVMDLRLNYQDATEADLFVMLSQFFCGGLSLKACVDVAADLKDVCRRMRQCGVRCDAVAVLEEQFAAFGTIDYPFGERTVPVRFPIVRASPRGATYSYFPSTSPGPYSPRACRYLPMDRERGGDASRYYVPLVMADGGAYAGKIPCHDFKSTPCPAGYPYKVSSVSTYPAIVCECGAGLASSFVCVHSGDDAWRVRFVPEINVAFTGSGRCSRAGPAC